MRNTVYARLFDRLADLIPSLHSAPAGAVFCAPPRIPDDMAVYCHIADADGDMRLIELADDNIKSGTVMPAPWLRLRVDLANKLAEVAAGGDAAAIKAQFGELGKACKSCHDKFREEDKK